MKNKKKKKIEWSKLFCSLIAAIFAIYGIWCGFEYYKLCRLAIETCSSMPEPTLAVVNVSTVIASLLSYLLYQMGLKNSRNKYKVDSEGVPFDYKENEDYNNDDDDIAG